MLRLNVLSGTTVLTILGRRALRAAQLSPKIHSRPPNEHKNPVCDAQTSADRTGSASKTASPHPLKPPMLPQNGAYDLRSPHPIGQEFWIANITTVGDSLEQN